VPGARLVTIGDCGHMPEMEKPSEFVRVVTGFLA
jgi:pimeloyl-ACP methyl ester carboxylesterase